MNAQKKDLHERKLRVRSWGDPRVSWVSPKLDGKEKEIKDLLGKGVNKMNIARIYGVSWATIQNFIKTRKLA